MDSYYELLQVEPDADPESIRRAFYRLAKEHHPDISNQSAHFIKILNAYKTLTDDSKRGRYDSTRVVAKAVVLPRDRLYYAVSLSDVARQRRFRTSGTRRRAWPTRLKDHDVCISLTQTELEAGSVVHVDVPAHVICPLCGGDHGECHLCSSKGYVLRAVSVPVAIPKHLGDGDVFELPLTRQRGKNFAYFMIRELTVKIKIFQG
jgi:DnaJ-class molecular chaperone